MIPLVDPREMNIFRGKDKRKKTETDYFKKYKRIVADNYKAMINKIDSSSSGKIGISFENFIKEYGENRELQSVEHGLSYALYVFDLWLDYAEFVPRDERVAGQKRFFWIRKLIYEDRLRPSLQKKYDIDSSINSWREEVGLPPKRK